MAIDPKFIVSLKGKDYPTWPGVLDAATKAGLKSITTRPIQVPSAENGHMAIVAARAEFEDGRVFEDLGDASPANCSAMIATAALRMASTRAKGRALRDAINVGQTMWEELPDDEKAQSRNGTLDNGVREQGQRSNASAAREQSRARGSSAPMGQPTGDSGPKAGTVVAGSAADPAVEYWCDGCGVKIEGVETKKGPVSVETIVQLSTSRWGSKLCHQCGRNRMGVEQANVPSGELVAA